MDGTQSPHDVVGHTDVHTVSMKGAMELLSSGELFPFLHLACLATIGHLGASLWPGIESAFLNVPVCSMVTVALSLIVLVLKIVEIVSVSLQHPWLCSLHTVCFAKKIVSKSFYKKFDQKSKTDFFSICFLSCFWAFLDEGSSKTRQTKYRKNKSDPSPFSYSDPPTHHGGHRFVFAGPLPLAICDT
jgi:hypothetical protein